MYLQAFDMSPTPLVGGTSSFIGIDSIGSADIDGDGNLDIIVAVQVTGVIGWFKNEGTPEDNYGTYGAFNLIANESPGLTAILAVDLNNDNKYDVRRRIRE